LKIAYDNQIFFFEKYGGISRYFTSLINELVKTENQYKIFSCIHVNEYLSSLSKNIVKGYKFDRYPHKTTRLFKIFSSLVNDIQISKWKPDILHETFYSNNQSTKNHIPIVITIHDMIHELYPEMFKNNDNTSFKKRKSVQRADKIICVSEKTKHDLINILSVPESKISVIYHGFTPLMTNLQFYKCNISLPSQPYLLYVGKRQGYKNFLNYIKAISISISLKKNFKLVFFGGGAFTESEINLLFKLGFSHKDYCYIEGNDYILNDLFKNAAAFIYPSLYEGFGLPLLEAMHCSCPIIASNSGSIPEIAGDAAQYFDPNSLDDIVLNICNVVYSNDRIDSLIYNGQNQLKKYSWEKAASLTNILYKNLL
jgi:glycosyltransferase involved in cell wall biosynthesis